MKKWKIDPVMCLSVLILIVLLIISVNMSGTEKTSHISNGRFEVILPTGYESTDYDYPVVYVLPQDGYSIDDSGIAEKLHATFEENGTEVIIVKVSFEPEEDVFAAMKSMANEMDYSYRTIAKSGYRTLVGTGTGAYLSYVLGIKESDMYRLMISIRGDFVSEENPWYETYGDVYEKVDWGGRASFEDLYTYMDAPVDDEWTDMKGSTNDLGVRFIKYGTSSSAHEFTVRPGEFTEEFLNESVKRVADRLTEKLFPEEETEAESQTVSAAESLESIEGDILVDLTADWYFNYVGKKDKIDAATLLAEEYEKWTVVQPGAGHWTKGYGNISEENVSSSYGADYFDYFIVGSGYYVKTFEMQKGFSGDELKLAIGYVDDRCEVFLNGIRIGATGMDKDGKSTGETTWAEYSEFEVDPELLSTDGTNTVVVRAWNDDPYGAGGWYAGPICLYTETSSGSQKDEEKEVRFFEETFESKYAASALGEKGTVENDYLVYLPEGYNESERYYPTVYLLHQFNSNHNSYKTDDVDKLLDESIASGAFDEMIVIIPNSDENSWWTGDWKKMLTEELIPLIDEKYRTIDDARYRLTAGCSMGGQGAYSVALCNPEYFSGAISFFGALSMAPSQEEDALLIAEAESKDYLDYYSLYFICGNQDSYGFGEPAVELHQILKEKDVSHGFFIENGGHDSAFYVPYFDDAFAYVRGDMYQSDEAIEKQLEGSLDVNEGKVKVQFKAKSGIEEYYNSIPASSYTENANPDLAIPLLVQVVRDGEVVHTQVEREHMINTDCMETEWEYDLSEYVDELETYSIVLKAAVFDRVVTLDTIDVK